MECVDYKGAYAHSQSFSGLFRISSKKDEQNGFGTSRKAAIITGGSAGLGLAIAKELAREGCDVCICARNEERLAAAKQEIQSVSEGVVRAMSCDVSVP